MNNSTNQASKLLLNALHTSILFQKLPLDTIHHLTTDYVHLLKYYSKGSIIYSENDLCTHMDLVIDGTLIIQQIDEYGNMLSITTFTKGQTIAGNILFNDVCFYPMTITAVNDVILLPLTRKNILDLCQSPIFLEAFLLDISQRANILSHTIKNITRKSLRNKIIDYLIVLYTKSPSKKLILPTTKTDLSQSFGVARPSLSRELTLMKKDGLLSYDRNTILLSDNFLQLYL